MNANGALQTRLTRNAADDYDPAWSPGGTKMAFVSNRDGNEEIYPIKPGRLLSSETPRRKICRPNTTETERAGILRGPALRRSPGAGLLKYVLQYYGKRRCTSGRR